MRHHIDGGLCQNTVCARTHVPPVLEPDCPRCRRGALMEVTSFPNRYAKCTVYMVCESCSYEHQVGYDGVL